MKEDSTWGETASEALELLRAGRAAEAFARIDARADDGPRDRPDAGFRAVGRLLYWQHRALPEYLLLTREQIRRLEAALADASLAPAACLPALGGACYDVASFTWPGWDEPGIAIGPDALSAGRAAAERCLALREAPENAMLPFGYTPGMARWIVGAHELWAGRPAAARARFQQAEAEAEGAEALLYAGYAALATERERPGETSARAVEAVLERLAASDADDAAAFREQLLACRRVLSAAAGPAATS